MNNEIEYSEQAYEFCKRPYTKFALPDSYSLDGTPCYIAICKEFDGCMSQGDTAQEALTMLEDAMLLWVQCLLDDNMLIPGSSVKTEISDNVTSYMYSIDFSEYL
jgi:predicted RNase H-like HicB family nuclease